MPSVVEDRIEYKFYASNYHINNLKEIMREERSLNTRKWPEARAEIDGFLSQITGALDAILSEINRKLNLNIPINKITRDRVSSQITRLRLSPDVMQEINEACEPGKWLGRLIEFRNHALHRGHLPDTVELGGPGNIIRTYLMEDPMNVHSKPLPEEVIPYFESSLQRVRQLIKSIRSQLILVNSTNS